MLATMPILRLTEASRGALMLATMPIWSAWLARAARKERLIPRQIAPVSCSRSLE
jgi:drug/metabolite transporter (DMT)-like permease